MLAHSTSIIMQNASSQGSVAVVCDHDEYFLQDIPCTYLQYQYLYSMDPKSEDKKSKTARERIKPIPEGGHPKAP